MAIAEPGISTSGSTLRAASGATVTRDVQNNKGAPMKIIMPGLAVLVLCLPLCNAETIRVYDGDDTFMGKPMIGAQPTRVYETDENSVKVYDGSDTFMGKPMIGAQPLGIVEQKGNSINVYDGKDTFMGKPMIGAQPIQVIETGD